MFFIFFVCFACIYSIALLPYLSSAIHCCLSSYSHSVPTLTIYHLITSPPTISFLTSSWDVVVVVSVLLVMLHFYRAVSVNCG
jgi:hypothetical protein